MTTRNVQMTCTTSLGVLAFVALLLVVLGGCQHAVPPNLAADDAGEVEVASVSAHGIWATRKRLLDAGIAVRVDGSDYPLPYRLFVPTEQRARAQQVLRALAEEPSSAGYTIILAPADPHPDMP